MWFRGEVYFLAREIFEEAIAGAMKTPASKERSQALADMHFGLFASLVVLSTGRKAKLDRPVRLPTEERTTLQRKALESLRKAFECGFGKFHLLRDSPLFASIRRLPEFQALVEEWEAKRKTGK
jgi:hypothetical protein